MRDYLNANGAPSAEPERGRQDKRARPTSGLTLTQDDESDKGAETAKRPKPGDGCTSTHDTEDVPMGVEGPPGVMGLVTRAVPMRPEEAQSTAARAAIEKELQNIIGKGVFDPKELHDWDEVCKRSPSSSIGHAMTILGCKNDELGEHMRTYKGRIVFQGNRMRAASGEKISGAPDHLYGKPVDLSLARTVMAAATLKGWGIEAGDIEGAYLNAELRGPPVYMTLPRDLWVAIGAPKERLAKLRNPCVRLKKALYGLPRSGFDWFASFDGILTEQLGWARITGYDSLYAKADALMAVYVDDLILAGTPHARRREWAAVGTELKLKEKPGQLDRFLGVKYVSSDLGTRKRKLCASQDEYIRRIVSKYNDVAPHPAGTRATPAAKHPTGAEDQAGQRGNDCRSFVGALMYVSRATRPDITFATNWMARKVAAWSTAQDKELEQLIGYLNATSGASLESTVDVRDRKGNLWLEMWVDADHAGEPQRRSTTGWTLLLRGAHGTNALLDWASRKQNVVARSSGEAETVALNDALARVAGANRGLCAAGIPALDVFEKILGAKLKLRVFVDAAVSKAAAEKGTSTQMKYISKTQGVDLFWLRDIVQRLGVSLEKVDSASNLADLLTKPLSGPRTKDLRHSLCVRDCQ